ncbi:MAG: HTH-type transcriptional activator RhaR [Lentisphaerae bacterium ADurb.Bin242]|nr:MAG: HTH-type transcriptional activator RhaR [Lentisphaerae bacterium ADurb.Bin242]
MSLLPKKTYYKKRFVRLPFVEEISWHDKFMMNRSSLKLPFLLVYGESSIRSGGEVQHLDYQGYSFNLITSGEGIFHSGNRSIHVSAGDLCIGKYLQRHSLTASCGKRITKNYVAIYDNLLMTQFEEEEIVIHRCLDDFAPLFLKIKTLFIEEEEGVDTRKQSLLAYELIYSVFSKMHESRNADEGEFKQFLHRLTQNLKKEYTLELMAKEYRCSVPSLLRLFRKYCGMSPMHFLKKARLEHASMLMTHPDISIRSAMLHCGYKDQSFFTREFKAFHGDTPLHYRKTKLKNLSSDGFPES